MTPLLSPTAVELRDVPVADDDSLLAREVEWRHVATYGAVRVYRMALPAKFYRVVRNGYVLETGSGQEELVTTLATALAGGMLAFGRAVDPATP